MRQEQTAAKDRIRFNYLKKLFRAEIRQDLEQYVNGQLQAPLLVEFDPTTACNYSCPECISAGLLNKASIPTERIRELIVEFARAGVKGIIFIGGGEPLAHKCMPMPIELAHSHGIAVGLTTNGSLIERHMDVLADCVSWTRVSMDAGTPETYDLFRPNPIKDSFAKVVRNMEILAKRKKGALGFSFLVMQRPAVKRYESFADFVPGAANASLPRSSDPAKDYLTNAHEIFCAAKLAKEIGCDYFEYKPMVDPEHFLLAFDEELRGLIADQDEQCRRLEDETFEVIAPKSIEYLHQMDEPIQPKEYTSCPAMELRTLVTPSGIYPCPYHRGREDKLLGSVNDAPFDEFWTSDERKKAMLKIDPTKDCGFYCIRHKTNMVLHNLKLMHEEGVPLLDHIKQHEGIDDPFF